MHTNERRPNVRVRWEGIDFLQRSRKGCARYNVRFGTEKPLRRECTRHTR